jgi:hypothetical protein
MKKTLALMAAILAPCTALCNGDSSLARMASDIENAYSSETLGRASNASGMAGRLDGSGSNPGKSLGPTLDAAKNVQRDLNTVMTGARNAADLWDASNLLDKVTDRNYEPDLSGEGAPEVPASLCGPSEACNECYTTVFENLDAVRMSLEKMRIAGTATDDYVKKSYALGDGLSGVTGLAALQWQKERAGIGKAFEHFKGTYDTKYEGLMKSLKDTMDKWNACEAQYGERDWYARFGFLYYQFMRDRYKRSF